MLTISQCRAYWARSVHGLLALIALTGCIATDAQVVSSVRKGEIARMPAVPRDAALRWEAARSRTAQSDAEIVSGLQRDYPSMGRTAFSFKILNRRTQQFDTVLLDQNGVEMNEAQMEQQERAAYFARYGRADVPLANRLASMRANDKVDVVLWAKTPPYVQPNPPAAELAADARISAFLTQQAATRRSQFVMRVLKPLRTRMQALGWSADAGTIAPVIHTRLPAHTVSAISRDLAHWPEIDRIYLSVQAQPQLTSTRLTIHSDVVERRPFSQAPFFLNGSGVHIAMIEAGEAFTFSNGTIVKTARVASSFPAAVRNNPYLGQAVVPTDPLLNSSIPSMHATGVAGIIGANQPTVRGTRLGIATGAALWAGGSDDGSIAGLMNMTAQALDWKANVMNLSFGVDLGLAPGALDRFYDETVFSGAGSPSVVVAAGNNTGVFGSTTGNVNTPALGYNVISVGAYDDGHTPGLLTWTDARMATFSSYLTPPNRHKPEVVAPGVGMLSALAFGPPWFGAIGSGTSFAAPHVTGVVGLMMQRTPSLQTNPAQVKAILIATSAHQVKPPVAGPSPLGGDSIVADYADDVARGQNGFSGNVAIDLDMPAMLSVGGMKLRAGKLTRVAISWLNDPDYADVTYGRQTVDKFDLAILDPQGNVVKVASDSDDSFRSIGTADNFRPVTDGVYTIQVRRALLRGKTQLGYAMWQQPSAVVEVVPAFGSPQQAVVGGLSASLWFTTDHQPLTNRTLTFHVDGDPQVYTAKTDAKGMVQLPYTVPDAVGVGAKTITVDFAGDADFDPDNGKLIGPDTGTATLDSRTDTVLSSLFGIIGVASGAKITIPGILGVRHPGGMMSPLAGMPIKITVNGDMVFSGVTDAAGIVRFDYTIPKDVVTGTVVVSFDGSGNYPAASATFDFLVLH